MGDKIVLSYGDCLLRTRDVNLLKPPNWLNDALIGFAFEYLFNQLTDDLKEAVALISPEVTHFIKLSTSPDDDNDDEVSIPLEMFLEPLLLETKRFVLMAINDQTDSDAPGGTHWSLLVYARSADVFVHFDSASSNSADASRVAERVSPFLRSRSPMSSSSSVRVIDSPNALKQSNGFDCGMFVICHAERLIDALLKEDEDVDVDVATLDFPDMKTMKEKRKEWMEMIYELARS